MWVDRDIVENYEIWLAVAARRVVRSGKVHGGRCSAASMMGAGPPAPPGPTRRSPATRLAAHSRNITKLVEVIDSLS